MSKNQSDIGRKRIAAYNSEIINLQYKIDEISRLIKELNRSTRDDLDETDNIQAEKKSSTNRISTKVGSGIANLLNLSYEDCVKTPINVLLKKLDEEQQISKSDAEEKLVFIARLSNSLLQLAAIRSKK
ncbi:hypothetical protein QNN88_10055 [Citrobacter sp. ANG330]|uniref:hypothetical protein n=1 Tax=Citrobacter sp. ANG330 TaxID=3048142 RepID=UPI0039C33B90